MGIMLIQFQTQQHKIFLIIGKTQQEPGLEAGLMKSKNAK